MTGPGRDTQVLDSRMSFMSVNQQELDLFSLGIKDPNVLKYLIHGNLAESALKGIKEKS